MGDGSSNTEKFILVHKLTILITSYLLLIEFRERQEEETFKKTPTIHPLEVSWIIGSHDPCNFLGRITRKCEGNLLGRITGSVRRQTSNEGYPSTQ